MTYFLLNPNEWIPEYHDFKPLKQPTQIWERSSVYTYFQICFAINFKLFSYTGRFISGVSTEMSPPALLYVGLHTYV